MSTKTMTAAVTQDEINDGYPELEALIEARIGYVKGPLFTTETVDLFEIFLNNLPVERRQHYNCHCCRRFVNTYGGLVRVNEAGEKDALLWRGWSNLMIPKMFLKAYSALSRIVEGAKINGVFLSKDQTWGTPITKNWTHLSGNRSSDDLYRNPLLTAEQGMAEKKEEYGMLCRAMAEYPAQLASQAMHILVSDTLERSEKAIEIARWFHKLHLEVGEVKNNRMVKEARIWLAVAKAPPGFCHIKTTMISTLLDDLKNGVEISKAQKKWQEKMHPLQYRRPTAPPKAGNIEQAEKLVAKLGIQASLVRRFAKFDMVKCFWKPDELVKLQTSTGGVFSHLRSPAPRAATIELPERMMTWMMFKRDILPETIQIEVNLGRSKYLNATYPFTGIVTAADLSAPPILQWDTPEHRNPLSWYFYHGGSTAKSFNLPLDFVKVKGLSISPAHYDEPYQNQQESVFFFLEGCRDLKYTDGGSFFPENLKSELNEVRSVMEAYAKSAVIQGIEEGDAFGLAYAKKKWDIALRTTDKNGNTANFIIDRWE